MSISYFDFVFLVSFMVSPSATQTTLRPLALPHHSFNHCYINRLPSPVRLRLSSNSPHSPDFLRASIEYELRHDGYSIQQLPLSVQHDFVKTNELCNDPLEFSTQNKPYDYLKLKISLLTGINQETFAIFDYKVTQKHSQETVTLYSKDMGNSVLVRVKNEGQQPFDPDSILRPRELFNHLQNLKESHNAICAVTDNSPPVIITLRTDVEKNQFNDGLLTAIEVVYRYHNIENTVLFPAFACTSNEPNKGFEYVIETAFLTSINFFAVIYSYSSLQKAKIPFVPNNSLSASLMRGYVTCDSCLLYLIEIRTSSKKCKHQREIITYISRTDIKYDARELRKGEVAPGFIGDMTLK